MGIENDRGFENTKRKVQIFKKCTVLYKKRVKHNLPFANARIRTGEVGIPYSCANAAQHRTRIESGIGMCAHRVSVGTGAQSTKSERMGVKEGHASHNNVLRTIVHTRAGGEGGK